MIYDDWPEETLYQGLLNRDQASLAELIRLSSRELSHFIRDVLGNTATPQDLRECVRDVFVTVWQEIGSYDQTRESLRTWITMRAKYIALDRRRKAQWQ
jgi:DNA-directed RNA polymerase specialized sigma24 family protein